ncbi:hypothetical protein [Aquitalea aquatilis]|uniref:hypothetical protein n=1 Tax=Aquitalea aquatilis TaxID=1537400 RepID=UPI0010BD091E|nr:hypothetical protein [Aquitalea aquatilis]
MRYVIGMALFPVLSTFCSALFVIALVPPFGFGMFTGLILAVMPLLIFFCVRCYCYCASKLERLA